MVWVREHGASPSGGLTDSTLGRRGNGGEAGGAASAGGHVTARLQESVREEAVPALLARLKLRHYGRDYIL